MRALVLCPNVPWPPQNGGHHRNLGLIRAIARFAELEVLAIGEPHAARAREARAQLATLGASLSVHQPTGPGAAEDDAFDLERLPDAAAHFRSPGLAAELARRLGEARFDVLHVEEQVMAQYVDAFRGPRVIDRHKVDFAYHAAMARAAPQAAAEHRREAARFLRWERALGAAFDHVLVAGAGDRHLLEPLYGSGRVSVVPIAIDDELVPPAPSQRRVEHVLLYGALDYGPNVEAQRFFFDSVWPRLRVEAPELRTLVVGSGRPPLAAEPPPREPRVELRGFVPHVRSLLQGPGALVVAVRVGGGARTKVLEALACGMPVVSTATGVENLDLVPGRDYVRAESAAEMAEALLRLHRDPALVAALAREGPRRVEAFRWSRVEPMVEAVFREVLARAHAAGPRHARPAEPPDPGVRSAELDEVAAELEALDTHGAARAGRAFVRLGRRLRRSAPVARLEAAAVAALDDVLAPAPRGGVLDAPRRVLARVLRALSRRR